MSRYSRMLLLFMHAITNDRDRVHSFLFGTRLTNVTRQLRNRDIDLALARIGRLVQDWAGGTRIGACLKEFNRVWSRRVLGQGAVVMLISDGLDRDAGEGLAGEMERLHKSCRRLIWLNPLLRFDAYAPISTGAKAMIRHVDDFRPAHNLGSLRELTAVLSREGARRAEGLSEWVAASRTGDDEHGAYRRASAGAAAGWREAGRKVAVATVVSTWGSSPRPAGSMLIVDEARARCRARSRAAASRVR